MATRVRTTYVPFETMTAALGIDDAEDAERIASAVEAASRAVDAICNRPGIGGARGGFWAIAGASTAVYYADPSMDPDTGYSWAARIGDWSAVGTVAVSVDGGTSWTDLDSSDWQAEPLNYAMMSEVAREVRRLDSIWPAGHPGRPNLRVVGNYGWAAGPTEVEQAARLLTLRWFKRQDTPLGVSTDQTMYVRSRDADVEQLLRRLIVDVAG